MSVTTDTLLSFLATRSLPYVDQNPISGDMIDVLEIDGSTLTLALRYPLPLGRAGQMYESSLRDAIAQQFPTLTEVRLTSSFSTGTPSVPTLPGVTHTIAVASGKGGVGKSTVAVNLAIALSQAGAKVGILDGDIYGPSIPLMMGITDPPEALQENGRVRIVPCDHYFVKVMSIGMLMDKDEAAIWRGPMASNAFRQLITDVEWGTLDYLIFDLPPGTGDIQLTLSQVLPLGGAIVVTTPQDVSLADARKGVRMFEKVNVPVLGIVENMSFYLCGHCGTREDIFSTGGGKAAAEELGVPFLGALPLVTAIRQGGDEGLPIVEKEPDGEIASLYQDIALRAAALLARKDRGGAQPVIDIDFTNVN